MSASSWVKTEIDMSKVVVLGAGMVGSAIALDLVEDHEVTSIDIDESSLNRLHERNSSVQIKKADLSDAAGIGKVIESCDLVVCAVPGFMGYKTMEQIIQAGKDVVDISFFPENSLDLKELAVEHGVTAIVDAGVAPGMDNLILGYHNEQMKISDFECLVGGLPKHRKWPFEYKAPFSPVDVIEEYTRPARYVENGHMVVKPALSDVELHEIHGVGTLESFNSDGLRTLIDTLPHIPNMKEKTLRYPGHSDKIRVLRDSGFFKTDPVDYRGQEIVPLDFTSRMLFDEWKLGEEEEELTAMQITIKGDQNGVAKTIQYNLLDRYDPQSKTSSMARTTGYTATAMSNIFLKGIFKEKGVFPLELVGKHAACFEFTMKYLEDRGILYSTIHS